MAEDVEEDKVTQREKGIPRTFSNVPARRGKETLLETVDRVQRSSNQVTHPSSITQRSHHVQSLSPILISSWIGLLMGLVSQREVGLHRLLRFKLKKKNLLRHDFHPAVFAT